MNLGERIKIYSQSMVYSDSVKSATSVDTAMYLLFMAKILYRIAKGEISDE